ncbi:ankyrin repeat domain-containing protein [Legionella spiritensis]|uniref:ankyrin repeat domain-containing protein n=1 Tax=Legionella spiritensis TaxID=452 RepID=UPI000F6BD00F|nr:ankyrin repeat domain-containing protein [Legionella spiritensis]VEG90020.1 Dot/Icm T4SS effector [Legionella spiritensis]
MTTTLVENLSLAIENLKDSKLKALIEPHINPGANQQDELFTRQYPNHRVIRNDGRAAYRLANELTYHNPLNMLLVYAPVEVCRDICDYLLSLDDKDFVQILSTCHHHPSNDKLHERVMSTLTHYAPPAIATALLTRVQSLPASETIALLFGSSYWNRYFVQFTDLLDVQNDEITQILINMLAGIAGKDLFKLFQTTAFPLTSHAAFIDLFLLTPPLNEKQALTALALLDKFDHKELQQLLSGKTGEANLLTIIFSSQPESVINRFIPILEKIPADHLKKLLTARSAFAPDKTPLQILFSRKDCSTAAISLFEHLNKDPDTLLPLLTDVSVSQCYSPLHTAVIHQNDRVIAYYLEQDKDDAKHKTVKKTMLRLARDHKHSDIEMLLLAAPVRRLIQKNALNNKNKQRCFDFLKTHPGILTTQWTQRKSLLHTAAAKGRNDMVLLLCKAGATTHCVDENGRTPLNEAIQNNHLDVLKNMAAPMSRSRMLAWVGSFPKLKETVALYEPLQNTLNKPSHQTFHQKIEQYCHENNDCYLYFLMKSGQLLGETKSEDLRTAVSEFIAQQLDKIAGVNPVHDRALQLQLMTLLFSLPGKELESLKNSLILNEDRSRKLGMILMQGLCQPAIYSSLSSRDHRLILAQLSQPAIDELSLPSEIARFYFLNASFTDLPPDILLDYAQCLTIKELVDCCEKRRNPVLLVLTLQRLLQDDPADELLLNHLLPQLVQELILFNQEKPYRPDAEFLMLLNLTTSAKLKQLINEKLREFPENSLLNKRLKLAFQQFKKEQPLLPDSLLRTTLQTMACDENIIGDPSYYPAYAELLPALATDETTMVLQTLDNILQPSLSDAFTHAIYYPKLENNEETLSFLFHQFNQAVVRGLLARTDRNDYIHDICHWFYDLRDPSLDEQMYGQLQDLIGKSEPSLWHDVQTRMTYLLQKYDASLYLLTDLRVLLLETPLNMERIVSRLDEAGYETLIQLREYCFLIKNNDFTAIIDYVLEARKISLPVNHFPISGFSSGYESIKYWLDSALNHLDHQQKRALSIHALTTGLYLNEHRAKERLRHLTALLENHSGSIDSHAMVRIIQSYLPLLKEDVTSDGSQLFIMTLHNFFEHTRLSVVNKVIASLDTELLDLITQYCLQNLSTTDLETQTACRSVMTLLCQASESDSAGLKQIKHRLGHQDLDIIHDKTLKKIATSVLTEDKASLLEHTINGVWIQRLLTSPRFVSACSPQTLQELVERYRLVSLTLKQDEFNRLNSGLRQKMAFYRHHNNCLTRLEHRIKDSGQSVTALLEKRQRLLQFRASDSIRALLTQLEDNCFELRKDNPDRANAALNVLYTHYNNHLSGLRSDWLFKIADFVVTRSIGSKGDIAIAQNTLSGWLQRYLPHKTFEQHELSRKTAVFLYDINGKKIGFINESNRAMTFIDDEPRSFIELPGYRPGTLFYDRNRTIMGELTPSGEIKRENIFQKHTSALLVAKVPGDQLSQSPASLNLLIADILNENDLDKLYNESDSEKQSWIEEKIYGYLKTCRKILHIDCFKIIIDRYSRDTVYSLLAVMPSAANAHHLLEVMLTHEDTRHELFSSERQNQFHTYLKNHNAPLIFAQFLLNHHNKPWFSQGLQAFATFAKETGQADLLIDALHRLHKHTCKHKTVREEQYDRVLTALLDGEEISSVIWKDFLNADQTSIIQNVDNRLAMFFKRRHCTPNIIKLNEQSDWSQSYQYRLILLILDKQRDEFFRQQELRYDKKNCWTARELGQYSHFVKMHGKTTAQIDRKNTIADYLISELVFRCANFGDNSLFYTTDKKFDGDFARKNLHRSYLNAIAARHYLPDSLTNLCKRLKNWFNRAPKQSRLVIEELKANQAIIDWKKVNDQTWDVNNSMTSLPIITAYLVNYSGSKDPLVRLITDYCTHPEFQKNSANFYPLTNVMIHLPDRDVSACLFSVLEDILSTAPELMDYTIFSHLASCYANRHVKRDMTPHEQQLALTKHFGLQQKYALVQRCCHLSRENQRHNKEPGVIQLIKKIETEARTEQKLGQHIGKWYFNLWQFVKRFWHYGHKGINHPTEFVTFCDSNSSYTTPIKSPDNIRTPEIGGQVITAQLVQHEKLQIFKKRYEKFLQEEARKKMKGATASYNVATEKTTFFSCSKEHRCSFGDSTSVPDPISLLDTKNTSALYSVVVEGIRV